MVGRNPGTQEAGLRVDGVRKAVPGFINVRKGRMSFPKYGFQFPQVHLGKIFILNLGMNVQRTGDSVKIVLSRMLQKPGFVLKDKRNTIVPGMELHIHYGFI